MYDIGEDGYRSNIINITYSSWTWTCAGSRSEDLSTADDTPGTVLYDRSTPETQLPIHFSPDQLFNMNKTACPLQLKNQP